MARRTTLWYLAGERMRACLLAVLAVGLSAVATGGCGMPERLEALPLEMSHVAFKSTPHIRFYPDDKAVLEAEAKAANEREFAAHGGKVPKEVEYLAVSGGGDDGAFGAGLLVGWTKSGKRPTFKLVTGISTGALTAPFAYLGPDYDEQLRAVYTRTGPDDIFSKRNVFAAVTDDAMADTTPLRETIMKFLSDKMVADIATEYGKGRLLLVMTTNLDAGRPVIWNIGAIASSDMPNKRDLIARILQASAAIPGAFPPVMLDVTIDGKKYQEMHVDGGAVAQAFLYPPSLNIKKLAKKQHVERKRVAYVIRNGRLNAPFSGTNRQTIAIAGRAIATMIASSGVNDTYRIYTITKRDGVDFNLAYIGDDFTMPYKGPFDSGYMGSLFDYGYKLGLQGYRWHKTPPGYAEQ